MPARKKSKTTKVTLPSKRYSMGLVSTVIIFAVLGSYLLIASYAADKFYGHGSVDPPFNYTSLASGDAFNMSVRGQFGGSVKPYQILIEFRYDPGVAKLLNVACKTSLGCAKSKSSGYVNSGSREYSYKTGFVVCIDAGSRNLDSYTQLFSMSFKKLTTQNDSGYATPGHLNWWTAWFGAAPGSCNANQTGKGAEWFNGTGSTCNTRYADHSGSDPQCDNGEGIGDAGFTGFKQLSSGGSESRGKNNTGNDSTGVGSGAGGGGSGGSTAQNENDKPSTVPSSSDQGNDKQPELKPSPFYDGKQYTPGSDPLDKAFGNITVAGQKVAHGWTYLVIVLLLAGSGGGYYFLRIRKRRP